MKHEENNVLSNLINQVILICCDKEVAEFDAISALPEAVNAKPSQAELERFRQRLKKHDSNA